jgi:hypothetical protein
MVMQLALQQNHSCEQLSLNRSSQPIKVIFFMKNTDKRSVHLARTSQGTLVQIEAGKETKITEFI